MRTAIMLSLCAIFVSIVPAAGAARLPSYDVVGTDPLGDAIQPFVTGVNWPQCGTGIGCTKYDILGLDMGTDATSLHIQIRLASRYWGTTSAMFVSHFTVGDKKYFTCWNINSVGLNSATQYVDVAEEMTVLSCTTRFSGETRVGPTTRATGTDVGDAGGVFWVRWEVPLAAIGNPAAVTNLFAEVWARSANPSHAPATSPQALYVWNLADRAPNADAWSYSLGVVASKTTVDLVVEPSSATAAPGAAINFTGSTSLLEGGSATYSLSVVGLPTGWESAFETADGTVNATSPSSAHNFTVTVPSDASDGATNLTLVLTGSDGLNASANFTITVDAAAPAPPSTSSPPASSTSGAPASSSSVANETGGVREQPTEVVPGASVPTILAILLLSVAIVASRRQPRAKP